MSLLSNLSKTFLVAMCFGIFISRTFIRDLDMGLYFGGDAKESVKALRIKKKGD
jgi:hypothetical protein